MATSRSLAVNSESPTGGRDEGTAHKLVGNKFANDGSFFEMFRRQMEEKEKSKDMKEETSKDTPVQVTRSTPNRWDVPVEGRTECRAESSSQEGKRKEERTHSKPYQGLTGKRKALMKTVELREKRKRRREEIEEQQDAEEAAGKSSAWKAYMAEVKAYEERTCTDQDGHKRPLVK